MLDIRAYKRKSFSRSVWNLNNVDVDSLNDALLNANWDDIFRKDVDGIDVVYDRFFSLFISIVEYLIPRKIVTFPTISDGGNLISDPKEKAVARPLFQFLIPQSFLLWSVAPGLLYLRF